MGVEKRRDVRGKKNIIFKRGGNIYRIVFQAKHRPLLGEEPLIIFKIFLLRLQLILIKQKHSISREINRKCLIDVKT
jgi:hypothetical protein